MSSLKVGLISGNRTFPLYFAKAAKEEGVDYIAAAAFHDITDSGLAKLVDRIEWFSIGQLNRLIRFFKSEGINEVVMAGQIPPTLMLKNLKLDWRSVKLLGRLKNRNADTVLGAIAEELQKEGISLVDSTKYMKNSMPNSGVLTRKKPNKQQKDDILFGLEIAKGIAGMDIGQTVIVKNGVVLAVEAVEGTDEAIRRAAKIGRERIVVVKVAKPDQDMRFDVPIIGIDTIDILKSTKAAVLAVEADMTLFLDKNEVLDRANQEGLCIVAQTYKGN